MIQKILTATTLVVALAACSSNSYRDIASTKKPYENTNADSSDPEILPIQGQSQLIILPNEKRDHSEFIDAINGAKQSIDMMMFHLSDKTVVEALVAAIGRNVNVHVIVDRGLLKNSDTGKASMKKLNDTKADTVRPSTPSFDLTHAKSMVIDGKIAFVTSINLTNTATDSRDMGIITEDPSIIKEMLIVFNYDWGNYDLKLTPVPTSAKYKSGPSPDLGQVNLVWSPVDSEERLVHLIGTTKTSLDVTVENLGNIDIQNALVAISEKLTDEHPVRILVPMCNEGATLVQKIGNYKFIQSYQNAIHAPGAKHHLLIKMIPEPASADHPYMHQKMIISDGNKIYIGSENFSDHSLFESRELGIIFLDDSPDNEKGKAIEATFNHDWGVAVNVPTDPQTACGKVPTPVHPENNR